MGLKAVIVDSSAISRDLLSSVLVNASYEVVGQAHIHTRGLALVQKFHPHFICIDRDLAEEGAHVFESLREANPKMLIFVMSSELDAGFVQRSLALGVNGFIVKPFNADAVLKVIRNAVLAMVKKNQAG